MVRPDFTEKEYRPGGDKSGDDNKHGELRANAPAEGALLFPKAGALRIRGNDRTHLPLSMPVAVPGKEGRYFGGVWLFQNVSRPALLPDAACHAPVDR